MATTTSYLYPILQAVQAAVQAFGFQISRSGAAGGSQTIPVVIRREPRWEEGIEGAYTPPIVCVCPSQKRGYSRAFGSELQQDILIPVDGVLIFPNNMDITDTFLDDQCGMVDKMMRAFQDQLLPAVPTVIACTAEPWQPVDKQKLRDGWGYQGATWNFRAVVARTN